MELDWPSRSPGSGPWVLSRAENIFGIYFGQSPIKRYTVQENVFGSLFGYEVDFQELFNRKSAMVNPIYPLLLTVRAILVNQKTPEKMVCADKGNL